MRSSVLGVGGLAVYASGQRPPLHICAAMRRGVVREPGTRGKTACQRHHESPSSKTHPLHVTPFSRYKEAVSPRLNASPSSSLHHPQWRWSQGGVAQWQSASEFVFLSVNFVFLSDLHSYHSGRRAANGPGFDPSSPNTHMSLGSMDFGPSSSGSFFFGLICTVRILELWRTVTGLQPVLHLCTVQMSSSIGHMRKQHFGRHRLPFHVLVTRGVRQLHHSCPTKKRRHGITPLQFRHPKASRFHKQGRMQ